MKEQQEKIRVLDPHIILILFISAFVFGIGILMIFLERKEIRTEGYEFIIFSVEILMLLLILYYMRTVVLSREGCTVSWLFWKRNYKWEELAVIREDVWYTYGKGGSIRYQGIVFSKYAVNKKKKKYTTRMIVDAFPLSDCFYITFDEHGNVFSYKLEKGKKQVIRKMYVNVREKMKEWGVEAEKGEGIKEEEKQRQYDEMIELRRQQRKKIQSKGADCTNLKEYQQEVIKIRYFLQITMVILITVLLIWTGLSAEEGERIPLTICDYDREAGTITIVFMPIGESTKKMKDLKAGDAFMDFVGPLGQPSEFCSEDIEELKKKRIVFVAGGVGTAPVYPQLKWLHEHGITADAIVGAKTKDLVILEKEMSAVSNLYITTDDGSYVRKGMGTDVLRDLVQNQGKQYDVCVAIGPMIMMKFVCLLTKELNIPTVVSMNPIMVDGTGMCGACRLMVGNEVKFACVDGPEFDGHLVDFDLAMKRQQMYKTEEGRALLRYQEGATHHGGCGQCGGDK